MMKPNSPTRRARTLLICGLLIGSLLFAPVFPQAAVMQQIRYGTVVSVSQAVVKTGPTGVGAAVGGTAGALAGAKPEQAFYVKIGLGETMTALDILEGRMIVEIGMAVVRPAEFIILKFTHKMPVS